MLNYKALLLDLDGTLLDTREGVIWSVKKTISDLKLEPLSNEILEEFVGPPMQISYQKFYNMSADVALDAANLFRANYKEYSLMMAVLYPGVLETLSYLKDKGYLIAVATNKSHDNAIKILQYYGVAEYCDYMLGSDLEGKLDKADIIASCLKKLKVKEREALYIGDSQFDLEGAKKNNIDFIGVSYGYGFRSENGFDGIMLDSFSELMKIL